MDNLNPENNKKKLLLVAIFSAVILFVMASAALLYSYFRYKEIPITNTAQQIISTNFPVSQNGFDMYSFSCIVKELFHTNKEIQTNMTIKVGILCDYHDVNLKEHEIKVPLVVSNSESLLASNKIYSNTDFFKWTVDDHLNNISRYYYYGSENKYKYANPNEEQSNYFTQQVTKPTISKGDTVIVSFALNTSAIYSDEELGTAASFFKEYHQNITGYDNLESFLKTGEVPELLFTEGENWIIPNWVMFDKDNDI